MCKDLGEGKLRRRGPKIIKLGSVEEWRRVRVCRTLGTRRWGGV